MPVLPFLVFAVLLSGGLSAKGEAYAEKLLAAIHAPTPVAIPPENAVRSLCVTADGEIRHYGQTCFADDKPSGVYIASRNGIDWTTHLTAPGDAGTLFRSPYSGEWVGFKGVADIVLVRSKKGPGGGDFVETRLPWRKLELRQIIALSGRQRLLAAFSNVRCENGECYHAAVAHSDDDGRTWKLVHVDPVPGVERQFAADKRPHWFNDGCEPSITELKDGSVLMAVRTSGPLAAFYRSTDGGETWGKPWTDPAFHQANTMPLLFRLRDGRLVFFWNNTAMLPTLGTANYPEMDPSTQKGVWESFFTNRDALHAAISEDDGKTWIGFREIALNPIRNDHDFRELGYVNALGFKDRKEGDKSVHQTQALELPNGKVLIAYGQNPSARRLAVFDPSWLYEKSRTEDFYGGLVNVSTHLYVKSMAGGSRGWSGHCAFNRLPGCAIERESSDDPKIRRQSLHLCRIPDERLVSDRQGVVWNFPATRKGHVEIDCRVNGAGFRLSLLDHWCNPCDWTVADQSFVSVPVDVPSAGKGVWTTVSVSWDLETGSAVLCDGTTCRKLDLRTSGLSRFGASYLHLQTLAEGRDPDGAWFRAFRMAAD